METDQMTAETAAHEFVKLVRSQRDWELVNVIPDGSEQVLLQVLGTAGFESTKIAPGPYGEPNDPPLCFKVLGEEGEDDHAATAWLHSAFECVLLELKKERDPVLRICTQIKLSVPLAPIELTTFGAELVESPRRARMSDFPGFVDHTVDTDEMGKTPGCHRYCGGYINRKRVSKTWDVLLCGECRLDVLIPREGITTYEQLRRYMKEALLRLARTPS